ncbi:MAG: glucose-6-phosphate dehydrogenase [Planctomycetes bacterium]|nr:glucose-6-phosphate dehydrogenase [Planctomycetota bacterium]
MAEVTRTQVRAEPAAGGPILKPDLPDPCLCVNFGATGDLSRRMLVPALYALWRQRALPPPFTVIGFSRSAESDGALRDALRSSTKQFAPAGSFDDKSWEEFEQRIFTSRGDVNDPASYRALQARMTQIERERGTQGNRLFYLAVPPSSFPGILRGVHQHRLLHPPGAGPWSRVVIEKPFGRDLKSARVLNRLAAETVGEKAVYRIDHFLGKETVQNLLVLRFANSLFEPVWNRKHLDHVQITVAEDIGIENRARFYDETGVLRDMVQNHLLQLLALVAMEPPVSFTGDDIRDGKVRCLRSLRPGPEMVCGQYRGYRGEEGVAPDSRTPTYAALRVMIDNWRWQGVPFYLRTGKRLARKTTEIVLQFQSIPFCLFGREDVCRRIEPNTLAIRIQPDEGISLRFAAKAPGEELEIGSVRMDFSYEEGFRRPMVSAYERLLLDCMRGDQSLFLRADAVEHSWEFMGPPLEAAEADPEGPKIYEPGSTGPREAALLLSKDGRRWTDLGK